MAYKALQTSEPRYDVASIAAKTGRSITHATNGFDSPT